ncbi:Protein FAM50B [Camelus dromedarius]|uniref:Protein FAM50B n=1 Tax=Camelus dromedarius TaxID=9838 RepID=A0A5N4CSA6_CAMDR|nr:Protein FAM50B [Camelus dromedarius]
MAQYKGTMREASPGPDLINRRKQRADECAELRIAEETIAKSAANLCKDPAVDTSFLPDREREEETDGCEELRREWELWLERHYTTHTFYDLIVAQARGKSGPLFAFDVHDDVRLLSDATREKDESHAGKVVLRSWYEKNKHIFPASRWEPYDPEKKWDRYTVR